MKEIKTIDEIIAHLKQKGVTFNYCSEDDAKKILEKNNYFFKLSSYRFNYKKYSQGAKKDQYINLDFSYLLELSYIDAELRKIILMMCLDIEHYLKVRFLFGLENKFDEDGYDVIKKFISKNNNEKTLQIIKSHKASYYVKDLIDKYYPYFPAWVFVEVISFGVLTYLIDFYSNEYHDIIINNKFMNIVRDLRNASAHNNCLINKMFDKMDVDEQVDVEIMKFIKKIKSISNTAKNKYLRYRMVYNFVVLIYVYNIIVPKSNSYSDRYNELKKFFNVRLVKNKHYFAKDNRFFGIYLFLKNVIDNTFIL